MAQVYFHRKKDNPEIVFYVGISKKDNELRANSSHSRTKIWHNTVLKHGLIVEIVHSFIDIEEAKKLELIYIKKFGRREIDGGTLVNYSKGGDIGNGNVWTEDRKNRFKPKPISEKTREKMRLSQLGKKRSYEQKQKMSTIRIGKPVSIHTKEKIRVSLLGHSVSQETRDKMSLKLKGRTPSNESILKMSKSQKGRKHSESTKIKMSKPKSNDVILKMGIKLRKWYFNTKTGIAYFGAKAAAESINMQIKKFHSNFYPHCTNHTDFIKINK